MGHVWKPDHRGEDLGAPSPIADRRAPAPSYDDRARGVMPREPREAKELAMGNRAVRG